MDGEIGNNLPLWIEYGIRLEILWRLPTTTLAEGQRVTRPKRSEYN